MKNKKTIAIGDLGSNSFHMALFAVEEDRTFSIIDRKAELNQLGRYLVNATPIPDAVIKESGALVSQLCAYAKNRGSEHIYLYGTGIFRHAVNRERLIDCVTDATKLPLHVLSEQEEIEVNVSAVTHYHDLTERTLILDIGGGSSEVIIVEAGSIVWSRTIRRGTASMIAALKKNPDVGWEKLLDVYETVCQEMPYNSFQQVIGTSGFMKVLSLEKRCGSSDDAAEIAECDVLVYDDCRDFLCGKYPLIDTDRRAIVEAGIRVLEIFFSCGVMQKLCISNASTREGYLIQLLHKGVVL